MYRFFLISLLITTSAFVLKKDTARAFKSEKTFELCAGNITMKISANGGRIISFRLGNKELLTNESEHENFGSTLWTAPQSNWGWPPYETLDKLAYRVEKIGDTLKMTSEPDVKSGLQIEKKFVAVDGNFIHIEYRLQNITKKEKAVGAWEVTRVPCGGIVFFPAGGVAKIPASTLKINSSTAGINWISIDKKATPENQKLFATASEGWLAYAFNDVLFIKQFPDTKPEDYSPQHGEVEIYINKEKRYAELENHGVYTLLKPGQVLSYVVNWYLYAIPKKVEVKQLIKKLSSFAG